MVACGFRVWVCLQALAWLLRVAKRLVAKSCHIWGPIALLFFGASLGAASACCSCLQTLCQLRARFACTCQHCDASPPHMVSNELLDWLLLC
jgi:hypothetical protein